jgi:hypothetical protein
MDSSRTSERRVRRLAVARGERLLPWEAAVVEEVGSDLKWLGMEFIKVLLPTLLRVVAKWCSCSCLRPVARLLLLMLNSELKGK